MPKKVIKKEVKPKKEKVITPEVVEKVEEPEKLSEPAPVSTNKEFLEGVKVTPAFSGLVSSDVTSARLLGKNKGEFIAKKEGSSWVVLFPNGEVHRVYTGKNAEENAKSFAKKQSSKTFG